MAVNKVVAVLVVLAASLLAVTKAPSPELLLNGGFEEGTAFWEKCWGFNCEITTDCHFGSKAMKISNRTEYYQGATQKIELGMGKRYAVEGYVKLLNTNENIVQYAEIEISETFSDGTKNYMSVARQPFLQPKHGWVHLVGDFITPKTGLTSAQLYVQGPEPGIDFIMDDMSLKEIPENTNWRAEADARIERNRKSDINFEVTLASGIDPDLVLIEINQTSNGFPFGTAIDARRVVSILPANQKYARFVVDNFNWAVPENALKWYEFEPVKGESDWEWGETGVRHLNKHGIEVRAHNMLWAVERYVPSWLKHLPPSLVRAEVAQHIKDTALRYKGKVKHWDVNNELLHGNWYETKLNDTEYTKEVFRLIHQSDPDVKLFLNDYNTVGAGGATQAYMLQGTEYKQSETPIHGMGCQSHFPKGLAPDPTLILRRLDRLAQAGLPLWTTELDVQTPDEDTRADWYETAFRVLFSHSSVEGIVMWGFWSEAHYAGELAALVSGPEFRINAAGKRYLDLTQRQWRTNTIHSVSDGTHFEVRGFHGDYFVNVRLNGTVVQTLQFELGKSAKNIHITVNDA